MKNLRKPCLLLLCFQLALAGLAQAQLTTVQNGKDMNN